MKNAPSGARLQRGVVLHQAKSCTTSALEPITFIILELSSTRSVWHIATVEAPATMLRPVASQIVQRNPACS